MTSRIMSSSSCVLIKLDDVSEVVWYEGGEEEVVEGKRKAWGRGEE